MIVNIHLEKAYKIYLALLLKNILIKPNRENSKIIL